ncbi:MAG: ATP-binding protein [Planctomycetota bacterium]
MKLTSRAARLIDLACSAVKAGTESSALVGGATVFAAGTGLLASPVFLPCVATVALGLAGRKVYKEHKAGKVEQRVEHSLKKLLEDYGSIQDAMQAGFKTLELGQIDGSIDHAQLRADLQTGLKELTKLAAMNRSKRLALAEQNDTLAESLNGFDERFDRIDEKLDKLLELLTHRPSFAIKPPPNEEDAFASLRFTNPKSTLVGRDGELEQLDAFLDHTPEGGSDFSFWLVTGPGGMGKSRLAHELCLMRQEQYWDVGFWEPKTVDDWTKWQPIAPTLIVFDYLLGRSDLVADAIRQMAGRTLDQPVRFLVLEREAQGVWWERVGSYGGGAVRQALETYQYQKPLELQGFLDDASARAFFERSLPADKRDQGDAFISVFRETDRDGRPIYAKAIVEAAEDFGLERAATFSRTALVLYILRKEHDRAATTFKNNTALLNGLMNLLAITTLARGLSIEDFDPWADDELRDLMPEKNAFETEDFRAISSSSGDHELPGLEPDLLGEMFVLQQLARTKTAVDRRRMIRAAWQAKPGDTSLMSYMAIADFGTSDWIDRLREHDLRNSINSKQELDDVIRDLLSEAFPQLIDDIDRSIFELFMKRKRQVEIAQALDLPKERIWWRWRCIRELLRDAMGVQTPLYHPLSLAGDDRELWLRPRGSKREEDARVAQLSREFVVIWRALPSGHRPKQLGRIADTVRDHGKAVGTRELNENLRALAIGFLKALYHQDDTDAATKQAAGRVLRDAGVSLDA